MHASTSTHKWVDKREERKTEELTGNLPGGAGGGGDEGLEGKGRRVEKGGVRREKGEESVSWEGAG